MIRGSCLCGAVEFSVDGELTPIQLCHATRCRKATGGAYAPELLAAASTLHWLRGGEYVAIYQAPLLRDPPAYRRAFCMTCGSPLPVEILGTPYVLLNPGVLDDDPGSRPFRHAFTAQKASWYELTDELPSFPAQPPPPAARTR